MWWWKKNTYNATTGSRARKIHDFVHCFGKDSVPSLLNRLSLCLFPWHQLTVYTVAKLNERELHAVRCSDILQTPDQNAGKYMLRQVEYHAPYWVVWYKIKIDSGKRFLSSPNRSDRRWDPDDLLSNGCRSSFPWRNLAGA